MIESPNHEHRPRPDRRNFLMGAAGGAVAGGAAVWAAMRAFEHQPMPHQAALAPADDVRPGSDLPPLPGKYPGRVREIYHSQAAKGIKRNREAIQAMLARGMKELVADSGNEVEAWRAFFKPGDRVGIKVVPVGRPDSISSPELVQEVIAGLQSAGVRARDILVFDRYENEFRICKYPDILPDGVHWECESVDYDEQQVRLDGQLVGQGSSNKSSGYDRDVYREIPLCAPEHDPKDDRRFRSHLSKIISRKIDKMIGLPVLKDHRSSGVTLALKNLSHGSVNNVCRSHISTWDAARVPYASGMTINNCGLFIPSVVSLPEIRQKSVLQILDGLVATYEGGPGSWNATFATWNRNSLMFATDPVAMDHIGWMIIDEKRKEKGWKPVAQMGLEGHHRLLKVGDRRIPSEQFQMRQPEHISIAARLGLGTFPRHLIDYRKIDIG